VTGQSWSSSGGVGVAECSTGAAEAGEGEGGSSREDVADPDVLCPRAGSKEKPRSERTDGRM
jgi:hypothetical protein